MNLRYITCSDPREFNDIRDIVKLAKMSPRVEIAVQAHPSKMSPGMPCNEWFHELVQYVLRDKIDINLAVHVNREWCDAICRTGNVPAELSELFGMFSSASLGKTLINRWQLNMPKDTINNINVGEIKHLLWTHPEKNFIFQYNDNTRDTIYKLFRSGARFSVLYDASGGRGIAPRSWDAPVFPTRPQGYSGGLSPENVVDALDSISVVAKRPVAQPDKNGEIDYVMTDRNDIWIDAEGRLKTDDKFDIRRARQYVLNAENWLAKHR